MERIVQQPQTVQAQSHFSQLPTAEVERSTFDRSAGYKTTFNAGEIIPFFLDEVLPGDSFNMNATLFVRMATPIVPLFDNIQCDIHYFFVPNRIVWDEWEKFMGERENPDDDPSTITLPQGNIDLSQIEGEVADYFGLPLTETTCNTKVNELPFRGYRKIWNDWYRDQSLQDSIPLTSTQLDQQSVRTRNKRKDYLSSALPWPQKGDAVFLPLGTEAPVVASRTGRPTFVNTSAEPFGALTQPAGGNLNAGWEFNPATDAAEDAIWDDPHLEADLQDATAATINDIRTSFQIQRMLERDARGGTRYIEIVLSHFGVQSLDSRMQRPEYLGGGTGMININPIAQTSPTGIAAELTPQGNLSAVAQGVIKGGFNHSFTEHGYVFGLVSARADLTYQNGVDRLWSRQTRYDFYWPTLAHLGEQQILNKEVFVVGDTTDNDTWGYQERYGEYRFRPGRITGAMRSNATASLDSWHLAQDFATLPPLNGSFVEENPPIDRVVAVPSEPDFLMDGWLNLKCTRPMPVYSVPGLVDHF